jgi:predicted PurR-regulated permease PerM
MRPQIEVDGRQWSSQVGVVAWSFIGAVIAVAIVVGVLAAISEIVLPLLFAVVLAVLFKPSVSMLEARNVKPSLAAGMVVVGLVVAVVAVVIAAYEGVVAQSGEISTAVDAALDDGSDALAVDRSSLEEAEEATRSAAPILAEGLLTFLVAGVETAVGFACGSILGVLILYYLLKDGRRIRRSLVDQCGPSLRADVDDVVSDACETLRAYGRGRTVMSAIVSAIVGLASLLAGLPLIMTIICVNFIGGYIPYVGAVVGGGLVVLLALGEGGIGLALVMLVVVLVANLLLENVVEPRVMGRRLHIHPLAVLIVTTLGGVVGGIVGLLLAVPTAVILGGIVTKLRSSNVVASMGRKAVHPSDEAVRTAAAGDLAAHR